MPCRSLRSKSTFFACSHPNATRKAILRGARRSIDTLRVIGSTTGKNVLRVPPPKIALEWIRRDPNNYTVLAKRAAQATKLEWIVDIDFRFFPAIRDDTSGYVLHPADLAANKVTAAYGRHEFRDTVDK